MKMKTILIIGGIALIVLGYFYHKKKHQQDKPKPVYKPEQLLNDLLSSNPDIGVEEVDKLKMFDVVAFFKALALRKGKDVPFVAQTQHEGRKVYVMGSFNEDTNEIENIKVIATPQIDEDLQKILGNEPLIVLS